MFILTPFFDETSFDYLPIEEKDALMHKYTLQVRKYPKNTRIPLLSASGNGFYMKKGRVKVFISNEFGVERLLFYLEEKNSCSSGWGG
ncbi:MAG: hypothetical protein Q4C56_01785 [Peptococcaceae bacterium]|nr:hypothetical protein [Peptococcaceae bacterium]